MAAWIQTGVLTASIGGGADVTHTLPAMSSGNRLVVVHDGGYGYTDSEAGLTGISCNGVAMTRIGYRYRNPGASAGITACYVSAPLASGAASVVVDSDAAAFWESSIRWGEASGIDALLDVEGSIFQFSVDLDIDFTTGYANSIGIGAGGTPVTSGWSNITGSTDGVVIDDLSIAAAKNLAFTTLGAPSGRSAYVYAIRAASAGSSPLLKIMQQSSITEMDKQIHNAGMSVAMGALAVQSVKNRRHFLAALGAATIAGATK